MCCSNVIALGHQTQQTRPRTRPQTWPRTQTQTQRNEPQQPLYTNMSSIIEIQGNLLDIPADQLQNVYIVHQANCTSTYAKGLAAELFKKYPYCNIYKDPTMKEKRVVGACLVTPPVVHLFGQHDPGKARSKMELSLREAQFRSALRMLDKLVAKDATLYFPHGIGCGLAGGDWDRYRSFIQNWAHSTGRTVYIIKLPTA